MPTGIHNLPNNMFLTEIFGKLPPRNQARFQELHRTFSQSLPSQKTVAKNILKGIPLKTPGGKLKAAIHRSNVSNNNMAQIYANSLSNELKKKLFPGYAGHNNSLSYFRSYQGIDMYARYQRMISYYERTVMKELQTEKNRRKKAIDNALQRISNKKIKEVLNKLSKKA